MSSNSKNKKAPGSNTVRGRLFAGCWAITFAVIALYVFLGIPTDSSTITKQIFLAVVPAVAIMIVSYYRPMLSILALIGFIPLYFSDPDPQFNDLILHLSLATVIPAVFSGLFLTNKSLYGRFAFNSTTTTPYVVMFAAVACFGICFGEIAYNDILTLGTENSIAGGVLDIIDSIVEEVRSLGIGYDITAGIRSGAII